MVGRRTEMTINVWLKVATGCLFLLVTAHLAAQDEAGAPSPPAALLSRLPPRPACAAAPGSRD